MICLFETEDVEFRIPTEELDELGEPVGSQEAIYKLPCLVVPGATQDLEAARPNGVKVAYTLHIPKSFSGSLRGACACVRGEVFDVIGDPKPYTSQNTPGAFNMQVEVGSADG